MSKVYINNNNLPNIQNQAINLGSIIKKTMYYFKNQQNQLKQTMSNNFNNMYNNIFVNSNANF